jgi:hypothetical protein
VQQVVDGPLGDPPRGGQLDVPDGDQLQLLGGGRDDELVDQVGALPGQALLLAGGRDQEALALEGWNAGQLPGRNRRTPTSPQLSFVAGQ